MRELFFHRSYWKSNSYTTQRIDERRFAKQICMGSVKGVLGSEDLELKTGQIGDVLKKGLNKEDS